MLSKTIETDSFKPTGSSISFDALVEGFEVKEHSDNHGIQKFSVTFAGYAKLEDIVKIYAQLRDRDPKPLEIKDSFTRTVRLEWSKI